MYLISLDRNCDELVDNPVTHDGHVEDVLAMHPHCGYSGPLDEEIQELLDQMQGDDPVDMRANKEFYRKTMSHALRVVWENKQFGDQFMSGYSTTAQSDDSDPIQYEFEEVSSANPDPISGLSPHAGSPTLIVAGARYVPDLGEAANRSHTNLASFIRSHKAVNRFAPTASGSFSPPVKTATQDIPSNKRGLSGSAAFDENHKKLLYDAHEMAVVCGLDTSGPYKVERSIGNYYKPTYRDRRTERIGWRFLIGKGHDRLQHYFDIPRKRSHPDRLYLSHDTRPFRTTPVKSSSDYTSIEVSGHHFQLADRTVVATGSIASDN
ncbi:unnamed protein product [Tilletia caries]|nr:unnamed protein product [Tilletia caries]